MEAWKLSLVCLAFAAAIAESKIHSHSVQLHKSISNLQAQLENERRRDNELGEKSWEDEVTGETNPVYVLSKYVAGREEEFKRVLRPLFTKMGNVQELEDLIDQLGSVQSELDPFTCTICTAFIRAVKLADTAGQLNWQMVSSALSDLCGFVAGLLPEGLPAEKALAMCNGTVQHQGPFAYDAFTRFQPRGADARKHCEFHNICHPEGIPRTFGFTIPFTLLPPAADHQHKDTVHRGRRAPKLLGERKAAKQKNAATNMKIVQLTDIHLEPEYAEGSDANCGLVVCCIEQWGPGDAGPYGDYRCNTAPRTLDLFLRKIDELDPDLIIYTGDNPPHTIWDETTWSQWNCTRQVVDAIKRYLPGRRVLPVIGNHEMYPTNTFYQDIPETTDMMNHFTTWWGEVAGFTGDSAANMRNGAYYTELLQPGLRVLTYNSNNMYTWNWYSALADERSDSGLGGPNYQRRMEQFMVNTLQNARTNGEKVLVAGHHLPGGGDFIIKHSRWIKQLMIDYSDVILMHIAGHTHNNEFKLFIDDDGEAKEMIYVAPSLSPGGSKNPAIRMYYLDEVTYEVLDYDMYYLDLEKVTGVTPEPDIELLYSARDAYDLPDMSPQSWHDLVYRFNDDGSLFQKYHGHRCSGSPGCGGCNGGGCLTNGLCRITNTVIDEYNQCTADGGIPPRDGSTTTTTTTTTTSPTTTPSTAPSTPASTPSSTPEVTTLGDVSAASTFITSLSVIMISLFLSLRLY